MKEFWFCFFDNEQGDSKLTAKTGDGSIKKDALGHGGASSSATQGVSFSFHLFNCCRLIILQS